MVVLPVSEAGALGISRFGVKASWASSTEISDTSSLRGVHLHSHRWCALHRPTGRHDRANRSEPPRPSPSPRPPLQDHRQPAPRCLRRASRPCSGSDASERLHRPRWPRRRQACLNAWARRNAAAQIRSPHKPKLWTANWRFVPKISPRTAKPTSPSMTGFWRVKPHRAVTPMR